MVSLNRLGHLLFPAVIALALMVITPAAVLATVPLACGFSTSAISSEPLKETVTLSCPDVTAGDAQVVTSLIGPVTVSFYSGPDLNWTKSVSVPVSGTYKLSITITINTDAGPVTGTSTCCSLTVYDAAPTPTPIPVITPAPATPAPVITPRPATPRPATPRPVVPTPAPTATPTATPTPAATPAATDSPTPTAAPSASPSDSPTPSASPSQSAPPEPTASPSVTSALMLGTTSPGGGSDAGLFLVLSGLIALGLATICLLLPVLRRKRRQGTQTPGDMSQATLGD